MCQRCSYCSSALALTGVLAVLVEHLGNLLANFAVGELDIVLGGAVIGHEGEETVVGDIDLRAW
jgi:hypothetical protein